MLQTITWTGHAARLLDQTQLPTETVYLDVTDERQMADAIRRLVVRGAPAIGVAAAFGAYLGVRAYDGDVPGFLSRLADVCDALAASRPTAVNLFWALARVRRTADELLGLGDPRSADGLAGGFTGGLAASPPCHLVHDLKDALLNECLAMLDEDRRVCRTIGEHGLKLLEALPPANIEGAGAGSGPAEVSVLTHCNAGGLATVQYGTALAPIYLGAERGLRFHVYADETRPLLQGSRITAYELRQNGIPVTVICDNMAAAVMSQGKVRAVIVGTDRVAANGDVANKIGTLGVAILARHFGLPFYVACPTSSIDLSLASGKQIPIEQRAAEEVSRGLGRQTTPEGVAIYNPAFDVTPADLVTAIITEKGVVTPPYREGLARVAGQGGDARVKTDRTA